MSDSQWLNEAIRKIEADFSRSSDTHLLRLDLPGVRDVHLYLKDESVHPTGSLKHRLARSLFLYALCNGWIDANTTVIEASSGNTAISEAYFAQLLGLPFVAVVPADTSPSKLQQIQYYGGLCHFVPPGADPTDESRRLAHETGGYFMDQFTFAERATDWRGNNNVAESIFAQLKEEQFPLPRWIVCSAGTGGTSATIGRYVRYRRCPTQVCLADPEQSVYYDAWISGRRDLTCKRDGGGIEGIGRGRVEASFLPSVIDRCLQVPNAASIATIQVLDKVLRRKYGGSTGTNVWAACSIIAEMLERGEAGSVVTLACDSGERYLNTYYNSDWIAQQGYDIRPHMDQLAGFIESGNWSGASSPKTFLRKARAPSKVIARATLSRTRSHAVAEEQVC